MVESEAERKMCLEKEEYMKKKCRRVVSLLLAFSVSFGACTIGSLRSEAKSVVLRNNPFTYRYESDPLVFKNRTYISQEQANNDQLRMDLISGGFSLCGEPHGPILSTSFDLIRYLANPIEGKAGYFEIYSGEKRRIATSGITGKSHVDAIWATYKFIFYTDNGLIYLNRSGEVRVH